MIGVESMVTCTGLRYTQDYLTPGLCSLIKPTAMEKLMSFCAKIHTVMLQYGADKVGVDAHTHTQMDAGNDNTWRPKLASGQNESCTANGQRA